MGEFKRINTVFSLTLLLSLAACGGKDSKDPVNSDGSCSKSFIENFKELDERAKARADQAQWTQADESEDIETLIRKLNEAKGFISATKRDLETFATTYAGVECTGTDENGYETTINVDEDIGGLVNEFEQLESALDDLLELVQ